MLLNTSWGLKKKKVNQFNQNKAPNAFHSPKGHCGLAATYLSNLILLDRHSPLPHHSLSYSHLDFHLATCLYQGLCTYLLPGALFPHLSLWTMDCRLLLIIQVPTPMSPPRALSWGYFLSITWSDFSIYMALVTIWKYLVISCLLSPSPIGI